MTTSRWESLKDVFQQALELPPSERDAYVAQACGDDAALKSEVEGLLRSHDSAGGFLETPAVALVGVPAREFEMLVGRRVGAFRVVSEVGRGGMGAVYRARREDAEYVQDVALKIVPAGTASAQFNERFRQERRILATLEHPNIARLIDGGNTDDGRPYYAMEFVDGRPIDAYCAERRLGLRARLELFRTVCDAVAYANRKLVVHRDLKPTNIFVTADGSPKLLDFGIAKLLSGEDALDAGLTLTGFGVMTPEYASPEQVRGEPVTTSTDVYALGLLLYLLLTGRRAYEVTRSNAEATARTICQEQPKLPSIAAKECVGWHVPADVDTIVLKALRKEPDRRYASAAELSEDIGRYLVGLPVRARPDTIAYRTARFVGRHRAAVAATTLAFLFLGIGLAATMREAKIAEANHQRAEKRFQDVRRIANSLVFELHDSIADLPGGTTARALLLKRGSALLDTLAQDAPSDPVLAEEVASAYHRLGDVLWTGGESNVGEREASVDAHRKALAIREQLALSSPGDLDRQDRLASSHIYVSHVLASTDDALAEARTAVAIASSNTTLRPAIVTYQKRLANARYAEASQLVSLGRMDEAIGAFQAAAGVYERLLAQQPTDPAMLRNVTLAHKRLGAIFATQSRFPEAIAHYQKAVAADEARVARDPGGSQARYDLSTSLNDLGIALGRSGDWPGQVRQCERALALREELARADSGNQQVQLGIVSVLTRLARGYNALGRHAEALKAANRGWALSQKLGEDAIATTGIAHQLTATYAALGQWDQAVKFGWVALDNIRRRLATRPNDVWGQIDCIAAQVEFGEALAGRAGAARSSAVPARRDWETAAAAFSGALTDISRLEQRRPSASMDPSLRSRAEAGLARAQRALST